MIRDVVLRALRNGRFASAGCDVALSRGLPRTKHMLMTNELYRTQLFINQLRFPATVPESVGVPSHGYVCGNPSIAYLLDLMVFLQYRKQQINRMRINFQNMLKVELGFPRTYLSP